MCPVCYVFEDAGDVDGWWKYVAPCTGTVTFRTCGDFTVGPQPAGPAPNVFPDEGPTDIEPVLQLWSTTDPGGDECGNLVYKDDIVGEGIPGCGRVNNFHFIGGYTVEVGVRFYCQ